MTTPPQAYNSARHDVSDFQSDHEQLDRWLRHSAGQSQRRDAARTFVITGERDSVSGYYTTVVGELDHEGARDDVRRGMSKQFPIPVALVARLAVDRRSQGCGLGALLLSDAALRILAAAENVAIRAVVVHAIDDRAAAFYRHFGFKPLAADPRTLMTTVRELRASRIGFE
ncbi:MAG: GNAT family N-acetyltransferase [Solirubrobacteraceae bacterium]